MQVEEEVCLLQYNFFGHPGLDADKWTLPWIMGA